LVVSLPKIEEAYDAFHLTFAAGCTHTNRNFDCSIHPLIIFLTIVLLTIVYSNPGPIRLPERVGFVDERIIMNRSL